MCQMLCHEISHFSSCNCHNNPMRQLRHIFSLIQVRKVVQRFFFSLRTMAFYLVVGMHIHRSVQTE